MKKLYYVIIQIFCSKLYILYDNSEDNKKHNLCNYFNFLLETLYILYDDSEDHKKQFLCNYF